MSIYKITDNKLVELQYTSFASERINEFQDLQKFIVNSIKVIDKNLLVISTEFSDWEDSKRRIDILCVDSDANLVVIELKRTDDGGHMELQALRYSAMIANITFEKVVETYSRYLKKTNPDAKAEEELLKFFGWEEVLDNDFAQDVRIILISADFSKELTTSVLWLIDKGIDIKCIRIKPQKDGTNLYLDIQQIIPLPETSEYLVKLREKSEEERKIKVENNRARRKISELFELGLLKIGDKVIFRQGKEQGLQIDLISAEIVNNRQNCLKRLNDNTLYSFSKLRKILTLEYGIHDVNPYWGFTLHQDWITEKGISLDNLT